MTIEELHMGKKNVLVGIRLDSYGKELLDWALVKVADPGDRVVAIHVCQNSDCISEEKTLLDGYLEEYEGLCNKKQVALGGEVLKGNSTRKVLLKEAKKQNASSVIVGINKHSALGRWRSIAKYCAKRLPPDTEVMALYNGRIVFSRCSKVLFEGPCLDPKPSFHMNDDGSFKDGHSEFKEFEISDSSRFSLDGKDIGTKDEAMSPIERQRKASLCSISLPAEDFTKQRPGWPLLHTTSSITQPALEARNMSVVQWVMNLPHRNMYDVSASNSPPSYDTDDSIERETVKLPEVRRFASGEELPKDLKVILMKNFRVCEVFSHDFLKMATSNFSSENLITKGGSNPVYKGIIPEDKLIAVKTLKSSKEAWKDFIQEVDIVTTLKHQRIAPLLGVCVEENDLFYVYDLMSQGTLAENLHGHGKESMILSWKARYRIAVGVAEALNYLHSKCPRPIIHRDVKSTNILLTDDLEPQLCDFGLAIWGPTMASSFMDSDVVGTFGYIAPEYFMYGKVSDKIDVYAFGVVLLELLSGQKPIGLETGNRQESLVKWAKPMLENKDFNSILDPNLYGTINESQVERMGLAATLCLTQAARLRPKMCQILNILNGEGSLKGPKAHTWSHDGSEDVGNIVVDDDDDDDDDEYDDEVYPDSSVESHLSLAFLGVKDESMSFRLSSVDHKDESRNSCSPVSVEEYVKKRRWSRSRSLE